MLIWTCDVDRDGVKAGAELPREDWKGGYPMTEGTPQLRRFDDETLIDMYDHAHETGDAHCDAIAAELIWRGIEVKPCGHVHAS